MYSIDDPYLYKIFSPESAKADEPWALLTHKKRPQPIHIYGRSIHTLSFISGLVKRGINPKRINLIIPPISYELKETFESNLERNEYEDQKLNDLDAFDGDADPRNKVLESLRLIGVNVYENYTILDIDPEESDKTKIARLRIKHQRHNDQVELPGCIFVGCSQLDIEDKIFDTIQENGLVYNGRLIVQNNFQTTDPDIFACGKIVEFSQIYKNHALGRSLRLDKYSGRELGQKLGKRVMEYLGILQPVSPQDREYEHLPTFQMPVGVCCFLPNKQIYVRVAAVPEGLPNILVGVSYRS
jgi:hypothetical protein